MPNGTHSRTNHLSTTRKGVLLECQTVQLFKKMGYVLVMRSAGSRGPGDVLAVASDGSVILATCRANGILQRKERAMFSRLSRRLPPSVSIWLSRWGAAQSNPLLSQISRGKRAKRRAV